VATRNLVRVDLPPGFHKPGTVYDAAGRWWNGNLVRWVDGIPRPVGGWATVKATSGAAVQATGFPRGSHSWRGNDGSSWLAVGTTGTPSKAYAYNSGTLYDLTPGGLVNGQQDGRLSTGAGSYNNAKYGLNLYGVGTIVSSLIPADTWSLDNFGETLLGVLTSDGIIYQWDRNVAHIFVAVTGSPPTGVRAVVVTPQRFLFALGSTADPRLVSWPSQQTTTVWAPGVANSAGSFPIPTPGRLLAGMAMPTETLIWTDADLWGAVYIGAPFYYRFDKRGDNCGIAGPNAWAMLDGAAYWMGNGQFYRYNGAVQTVQCDVLEHVFTDLSATQRAKISAVAVPDFGEVTWYYPSASQSGTENDRYVTLNAQAGHWTHGYVGRSACSSTGTFPVPLCWKSDGTLLQHETGRNHDGIVAFFESGPVELGNGERDYLIGDVFPDTHGPGYSIGSYGVSKYGKTRTALQLTLYGSAGPMSAESAFGPYDLVAPVTNVRASGRQVRLFLSENPASSGQDWRCGPLRLDVRPGGSR